MNNPLLGICALGQSIWYDNLGRHILQSGDLERMINEDGITGVTSNPTIFEKAIGSERIYDNDLHYLVDSGYDVKGIYEALVVNDIRAAADLLAPIYEKTAGLDGYVSLEVSPSLAYDRAGTIVEAKRLFETVNRKNLMIKVPATPQGLEAVKELIGSGINVNITLIFSLDQYRGAIDAYIEGLKKWIEDGGKPSAVASVASFFVSRVDTAIDDRLKELGDPEAKEIGADLLGKAAIANAKMAYSIYKEIFHGQAFKDLKAKGARPQKIVWASTSTKNPAYPDTYYVDNLIGPETINTIPTSTFVAFKDHGEPICRLEDDLEEARQVFSKIDALGIDTDQIMERLLEDGVKAFADSFDQLLEGIAKKRTRLLRGWGHRSASLGRLQAQLDEMLKQLDQDKIAESIWNGDASVWSKDSQEICAISQRLGWLHVVETMRGEIPKLKEFAEDIKSNGFTNVVLLGMGGSSLAAEVFVNCFGIRPGYLDLKVLDTTVPSSILELERRLDLTRTLFIVASKSGTTVEVLSLYKYFRSRMDAIVGEKAGGHFIAITDPGTSLGKLAAESGFRRTFLNPADIGGRFSALSYFGLVPAALIGAEIDRILMRAAQSAEACTPDVPALESPGIWLGAIMGVAARNGIDKMSLVISPPLSSFGLWLEQLVAESTGKNGKGILPIVEEPIGKIDAYGSDRLFVYLRLDGNETYDTQVSALEQAGIPVVTQRLHTPYDLGREMFRWEFATAIAGAILSLNPFDQPNVQESKDITKRILAGYKDEGKIPDSESLDVNDPELGFKLATFLAPSQGSYVAFNAFVNPSEKAKKALQEMRALVRDRFKVATVVGFGPRYLHSTGQIHKGGAGNGFFILIVGKDDEDIPIPGEPYSFAVLKSAQAIGDYQALKNKNRRIIQVLLHCEADIEKLLEAVRKSVHGNV